MVAEREVRGIPVCLGGEEPSQKFGKGVVLSAFVSNAVLEAEYSLQL